MSDTKTNFVNFRTGLTHPKLGWMMKMLDSYGIKHKVVRSLNGVMLQVEQGTVDIATEILTQELSSFKATTLDKKTTSRVIITVDDLPDDHNFFLENLIAESTGTFPATTDEELIVEVNDEDVVLEVTGTNKPVAEDDESGWGSDDEDEDDEDESSVIDVTATVVSDEPVAPVEFDRKGFLRAEESLLFGDVTFPDVTKPIRMFDVASSNLSSIGFKVSKKDETRGLLYIVFKGSGPYRYNKVSLVTFHTLLSEAVAAHDGVEGHSVGETFHQLIKVPAEQGEIKCQRLDEKEWVAVTPKAQKG